jgi:hypothetical protein
MLLDCVDLGIWVIHPLKGTRPLVWNLTYYLHPSTMNMSARRPSEATAEVQHFIGYVETTTDALRLIMAARQGIIPRITRRLNDSERRSMIRSGAVFVFCVEESGIKRWTEGLSWSPSRIVGNFLVCHCVPLCGHGYALQGRCHLDVPRGRRAEFQSGRGHGTFTPRNVDFPRRPSKLSR